MHINMKYYIVTIGAIFIALGIGIMVGFNLNYDQQLSKQQAKLISDLDEKFEDLKDINKSLELDLKASDEKFEKTVDFLNQNVDKIVTDLLIDKNIGILSTNDHNDQTEDIENIIKKANGKVSFNIVLKKAATEKNKLDELSAKLGKEIKTSNDFVEYLSSILKDGNANDKLKTLEEVGFIKLNSLADNYMSCENIVISGDNDYKDGAKEFEKLDGVLLSKLKEENKYVVGVQRSDAKFSYVDLYSKSKIATVDNIDEGVGNISLVLLLQEANRVGNFGRLDSAEALLPYEK